MQAPPQPEKPEPEPAIAVRTTSAPDGSVAVQPEPPAEVQETVPPAMLPPATVPLPDTATVSVRDVGEAANAAVTVWLSVIVTVQLGPVPTHGPPQPLKS